MSWREYLALLHKGQGIDPKNSETIALDGIRKRTDNRTQNRIRLTMALFILVYAVIGVRLIQLGMTEETAASIGPAGEPFGTQARYY